MEKRHFQDMNEETFDAYLREVADHASEELERAEENIEKNQELQQNLRELDDRILAQLAEERENHTRNGRDKNVIVFYRTFARRVAILALILVGVALAVPTARGVANYLKQRGSMRLKMNEETVQVAGTEEADGSVREKIGDFYVCATDYELVSEAERVAWDHFEENIAPFKIQFKDLIVDKVIFEQAIFTPDITTCFYYRSSGSPIKIRIIKKEKIKAIIKGVDEEMIRERVDEAEIIEKSVDVFKLDSEISQKYMSYVEYGDLCIIIEGELEKEDFIEFAENIKII